MTDRSSLGPPQLFDQLECTTDRVSLGVPIPDSDNVWESMIFHIHSVFRAAYDSAHRLRGLLVHSRLPPLAKRTEVDRVLTDFHTLTSSLAF